MFKMNVGKVQKPVIKYCRFDSSISPNRYYVCYGNENCHQHGCTTSRYQTYQVWQYWLFGFVLFVLLYATSWLCKKQTPPARRINMTTRECEPHLLNTPHPIFTSRHTRQLSRSEIDLPLCNVPGYRCLRNTSRFLQNGSGENPVIEMENDVVLEQLFESFPNRGLESDPPSYTSVIRRGLNQMGPGNPSLSQQYYDPPPVYSSRYRLQDESANLRQCHETTCNRDSDNVEGCSAAIEGGENKEHRASSVVCRDSVIDDAINFNQGDAGRSARENEPNGKTKASEVSSSDEEQ